MRWASEDGRSARQGCGDRVLQAKGAGCSKAQKPYECEWGVSWAGPGAEPESTHGEHSTGLGRVLPWTQWETGKVFRQESNRICLYKKKTFRRQEDGVEGGKLGELLEQPWEK